MDDYFQKNKANILIVDDRENNLLAMETLLGALNQNIIKVSSGSEALKQVLKHDFAVILLDVMMPGMDGFETAEMIRQREKSKYIPIIFVTALAREDQYAFRGYETGAVDYIHKPVVPEILRTKVKVFVDLHLMKNELKSQKEELKKINDQLTHEMVKREKLAKLERLALVASKSYNAISITDKYGNTEWANEGLSTLSGYTFDELIGTKGEKVRLNGSSYEKYIDLVNREKKPQSYEEKKTSKDGREYWTLTTLTPVLDDKEQLDKILIVESNITELKHTEEELIRANQKAEDATRAKQRFLSNMSHEIRTPMNAVIGFTNLLLKTELTEKQKEFFTAIQISSDTLMVLINDILDLAKVETGKMTFEKIPFKLADTITEMTLLFEAKIKEKNLKLIKQYDSIIPGIVIGDPMRLKQIILNLLSNAIKFTDSGKITLGVRLLDVNKETALVEFSVTDTGIGIAGEKLSSIGRAFQQGSPEISRTYGGTGLGLAIVKKLVEGQDGKLSVKSKLNKGSTFSFILPFEIGENKNNEPESQHTEAEEPELGFPDPEKAKVLIAEDSQLNQLLVKTILTDFGYQCDMADNGKIALEKFQKNHYDIILMDLHMPEMDGFEVVEHIRNEMKSQIPILALTADVTTVDEEKCKKLGMNGYISKPMNIKNLHSKIKELLSLESNNGLVKK